MAKKLKVQGVIPAMVTPFKDDLSLDEEGLRRYVRHLLGIRGVTGILCNGYSGEITALSRNEQTRIVTICADEIKGRLPLFACVDAQSTREAVELARDAQAAGADAVQVNSPFQNLLRRGLLATAEAPVNFFRTLSDEVGIPMTVFQYPAWTGLAYPTETMVKLAEIEHVVGVKEAVDMDKYVEEYQALHGKVALLADHNGYTLLPMLLLGADGTMVGISNVGTEIYVDLFDSVQRGDLKRAVELMNHRLFPLMTGFSSNLGRTPWSFLARVKEALRMLGLLESATVRPPEPPATDEDRRAVRSALQAADLLP